MGYARAAEMIQFAGFEPALRDHLAHNCYPPLPATEDALTLATQAVEAVKDGRGAELISGTLGGEEVQAQAFRVVEFWRLDAFVDHEPFE